MCIYYTAYITTNLINNKKYIGVHATKKLNDRYLGSGTALKRAVKKYGRENFHKEILEYFDNMRQLLLWEAINVTQDIVNDPMYYNMIVGGKQGSGMKGKLHTLESRAKMSASQKALPPRPPISEETRIKMRTVAKNRSIETRSKISANNRARPPISEETRIKMRASQLGKKLSEEHKSKISAANIGREVSNETRTKISIGNKGKIKPISNQTRAKISAANKGRIVASETKDKISFANKNQIPWNKGKTCVYTEEAKAKMSAAKIGKIVSDETKAKISAALKGKKYNV